jgi:hypothetical protein
MTPAFWDGIEKQALNAAKARALAAKHGLVPEGAWKWGLRQLRKGKTKEQLGQAPAGLINASKRLGSENEAGALWGKGVKGTRGKLHVGNEGTTDIGGERKALFAAIKKDYKNQLAQHESMNADPRAALKAQGYANALNMQLMKPTAGMNTLHTHPAHIEPQVRAQEKSMIEGLRNVKPTDYGSHPLAHRLNKLEGREFSNIRRDLDARQKSSHFLLHPSGFRSGIPNNPMATDVGRFLKSDVGTHHNIVSPGVGVGVHTIRPDKQGGGKKLRSLLFKDDSMPEKKQATLDQLFHRQFKKSAAADSPSILSDWFQEGEDEQRKAKEDSKVDTRVSPRDLSEWQGPEAWYRFGSP